MFKPCTRDDQRVASLMCTLKRTSSVDGNKEIRVDVNGGVPQFVCVESNPTTGYQWMPASTLPTHYDICTGYIPRRQRSQMVGAPSTQFFKITPEETNVHESQSSFAIVYRRSFEDVMADAEYKTIVIRRGKHARENADEPPYQFLTRM